MSDYTVETYEIDDTTRLRIVYDDDLYGQNPLEDWSHGCSLLTFGSRNRTAFDIDDSPSPKGFVLYKHALGDYREFWQPDKKGEWYYHRYDHDIDYITPFAYRQLPSLLTAFNRECAAWGTVTEAYEGYSFRLWDEDWDRIDGFMWVTKESYRHLNMLGYGQAGPPMKKPAITKAHKQRAGNLLKGTFDAFNDWATGNVYGSILEKRIRWTTDDEDFDDRESWEVAESCWGHYIDHDLPWDQRFDWILADYGVPLHAH